MNTSNNIARSAGAMGAATLISRVMGLIREQVFAVLFGAGHAMDAYNIAFRIPNLLRDLFAEGAMSAALVPTFLKVRTEEGDRRGWRIAGLSFRALFVIVSILTLIGALFAPQLVSLYAGSFKSIPGKFELTVSLTRIMFPFFPLVALAAAFMAVLNACGVFFLPAFASALFNVGSVASGVIASFWLKRYGFHPIEGMAMGVLVGGFIQAFCQLPSLYRQGYRFPKLEATDLPWHREPALRQILMMVLPGTIGLAATQINILVNSILATGEGEGAVSWLNYAFRLMQFPIGVFGVSLAAATLPEVSKLWHASDFQNVERTLQRSLRQVFALNLPASAGLGFLAVPIIELIFEYGAFSREDTWATAQALAAYSIGLTSYSAVKVLVPTCYAMGYARVAVISSVLSVAVNLLFCFFLVKWFGFWGLALGTSLAAGVNMCFLLGVVSRLLATRGVRFRWGDFFKSLCLHTGIAAIMGILCLVSWIFIERGLDRFLDLNQLSVSFRILIRGAKALILILEGVVCVAILGNWLRIREVQQVIEWIRRKIRL